MTHTRGQGDAYVHALAWEAFSGNVHGMGPAVVELEFEERPGEPFLFFGAAMLPMAELEYTGIVERSRRIEGRFRTRRPLQPQLAGV